MNKEKGLKLKELVGELPGICEITSPPSSFHVSTANRIKVSWSGDFEIMGIIRKLEELFPRLIDFSINSYDGRIYYFSTTQMVAKWLPYKNTEFHISRD